MKQFFLRETRVQDLPALKALWLDCFDDTPGFVEKFFAALPALGTGIAAVCGDTPVGAAYMLFGQSLVCGGIARPVGYLYGVAVTRAYRSGGVGAALVKEACRLAGARGAQILATLPAQDSLYPWYEARMGVTAQLCRSRRELLCAAGAPVRPLSAGEYLRLREQLLCGKDHLRLTADAMEFEKQLLNEYGGGLFAVGDAIAAACLDTGCAVIRELICPDMRSADALAASVGAALGARHAALCLPAETGARYIAADCPLPSDCVWNLSFD